MWGVANDMPYGTTRAYKEPCRSSHCKMEEKRKRKHLRGGALHHCSNEMAETAHDSLPGEEPERGFKLKFAGQTRGYACLHIVRLHVECLHAGPGAEQVVYDQVPEVVAVAVLLQRVNLKGEV